KLTVALTASAWRKIVQTTALAPTANGSRVAMRCMCVTLGEPLGYRAWESSHRLSSPNQRHDVQGKPVPLTRRSASTSLETGFFGENGKRSLISHHLTERVAPSESSSSSRWLPLPAPAT